MERHVVVGAGPIGSEVARLLAGRGHDALVVTRHGSGPADLAMAVADAGDEATMIRLADQSTAIYNCANPAYHRWPELWPPISRSLIAAAAQTGAVLVTVSNLYGYGRASQSLGCPSYDAAHPMTEATPLAATGKKGRVRAQMWADALRAHQDGRIRATEVRASDYIGPDAANSAGTRLAQQVLRGKTASVLGSADRPHTWTFTGDVARLAVTAAADPRAWGHAWHVPSNPPRTQRELAADVALAARTGARPTVRVLPSGLLHVLGLGWPLLRELRETEYQFGADFVMDSAAAAKTFGLAPTPWHDVLDRMVRPALRELPAR